MLKNDKNKSAMILSSITDYNSFEIILWVSYKKSVLHHETNNFGKFGVQASQVPKPCKGSLNHVKFLQTKTPMT